MGKHINPRDHLPSDDFCLYKDQSPPQDYSSLEGKHDYDVCVIGAGFTGLITAYHLIEAGYKVSVIERHRVGWGASGRNGGQLIVDFARDIREVSEIIGRESAHYAFRQTIEALHEIKKNIKKYSIECDLTLGLTIPSLSKKAKQNLYAYGDYLDDHFGYEMHKLDADQTNDDLGTGKFYTGGLVDKNGGHMNPYKYLQAMAEVVQKKGGDIFEYAPAVNIDYQSKKTKVIIQTPNGTIHAKKTVFAGNAYMGHLFPELREKYILVRTNMLATNILDDDIYGSILKNDHAVFEWRSLLNYYRKTKDKRFLFGGGDSAIFYNKKMEHKAFKTLYKQMITLFPKLDGCVPSHWWGGYMCVTKEKYPEISHIDHKIYYAFGYAGHGIVPTHTAARALANMIIEGKKYKKHYDFRASSIPFAGRQDHLIARLGLAKEKIMDFFG
jgi:gamma-glutamylputrescine oxidase